MVFAIIQRLKMALTDVKIRAAKSAEKPYRLADTEACTCSCHQPAVSSGGGTIAMAENKKRCLLESILTFPLQMLGPYIRQPVPN